MGAFDFLHLGGTNPWAELTDDDKTSQGGDLLGTLLQPEVAFPIAAGLLGGQGDQANISTALQTGGLALASQKKLRDERARENKTLQYLDAKHPDIAAQVRAGLPMDQAWGFVKQRETSSQPKWGVREFNGNLVSVDENNPSNMRVIANGNGGARPLTPDERAAFGMQPGQGGYMDNKNIPHPFSTGVTVNMGGDKSYDSAVGGAYGKKFMDIQDQGSAATGALGSLNVMSKAMDQPGFYSGTAGPQVAAAKRLATSLGMNSEGVDSMETFNAQAKQLALSAMGGSLGNGFSNADRSFVEEQVPNLATSPEGNRALISVQTKIAQRKQQIAQFARQYAAKNGNRIDAGFDDALAQWSEQNPLFSNDDFAATSAAQGAQQQTAPTRARNPQTGETIELRNGQWVKVP